MFFGAAVMIALVADGDDDAGLVVVPAMGGDPGALAQFRARAVGGHQQARLDDAAVGQRHIDAIGARIETRHRGGAEVDALGLGALDQRIDQMAILDHVRERLARLDIAGKGQEHRPGGVLQLGIGDDHVDDRLRPVGDLIPDPDARRTAGGRRRRSRWRADRGSVAAASAGSATMTGISAPRPWRSASASASPANAPPPMTMLRCADMLNLLTRVTKLYLLPDYSWAKQGRETRVPSPQFVIPGRA